MTLLCITVGMEHVRSCTIRGQHLTTCAWFNGTVERECTGCLPRPAEVGMLCRPCWEKFTAALDASVDLITHLRSIERGAQSIDGVRSLSVVQPTYPQSWQESDQLWQHLAGVAIAHSIDKHVDEPDWPEWTSVITGFSFTATVKQVMRAVHDLVEWIGAGPEDVVSRTRGAEAAVCYYRALQRSLAMFPLNEKPSRRVYFRCRNCGGPVEDVPPLQQLDDRVFRCARCGDIYDDILATWDMKVWADEAWRSLDDEQQKVLLMQLKPDEKAVLVDVQRAFLLLEAAANAQPEGDDEAA